MTDDEYENCYLDCSFDYPEDSLDQNLCFIRCDRRLGGLFGLMVARRVARAARQRNANIHR